MNKKLKNFKSKLLSLGLSTCLILGSTNFIFADATRVVTIGADLSDAQEKIIFDYFGVDKDQVVVLEVNNLEERQYLEGIASEAQIGNKTFSCAYVEPTKPGSGLNIKTANVTWVNASIVATAMSTAGMTDANVVIAANFPVSGTGALTGIMKAFEDATGEALDEEKKELATEELVTTGGLAQDDNIGQDLATGIVNDIKTEIIKNNTNDSIQIAETITNITNNYNITLTDEQEKSIQALMEKIAAQDYDYNEMKDSLQGVKDSVSDKLDELGIKVDKSFFESIGDFFSGIGDWFKNIFSSSNKDLGILNSTDDSALGEDVVIDATDKDAINLPSSEEVEGFFTKIMNWFKDLFSSTETAPSEDATEPSDNSTDDAVNDLNENTTEETIVPEVETNDVETNDSEHDSNEEPSLDEEASNEESNDTLVPETEDQTTITE